jgi:hypothetical protein
MNSGLVILAIVLFAPSCLERLQVKKLIDSLAVTPITKSESLTFA